MEYDEMITELDKARKLNREFQSKVLDIIRYIKTHVDSPLGLDGWNRIGYYESDILSILKFDNSNYHEFRIIDHKVKSIEADEVEVAIALDILQVMELKTSEGFRQCNPMLIFMFSFKKSDVSDWASWPDSRDNDWIEKIVNDKIETIVSCSPDMNPNNAKDTIFISRSISIENLISEKDINCQLQGLNELYTKEVAQKCNCMIKPIFNLDSSNV